MKKLIEKQYFFNLMLEFLFLISKWETSKKWILSLTSFFARVNLKLNKPTKGDDVQKLAATWKMLMPPDGQDNFKISSITGDTAFVEIHLKCPLRGTGKVQTCHSFMNYDREQVKHIGGNLIVLESQSNSGNNFCKLAIRKSGDIVDDLIPAHLNDKMK